MLRSCPPRALNSEHLYRVQTRDTIICRGRPSSSGREKVWWWCIAWSAHQPSQTLTLCLPHRAGGGFIKFLSDEDMCRENTYLQYTKMRVTGSNHGSNLQSLSARLRAKYHNVQSKKAPTS